MNWIAQTCLEAVVVLSVGSALGLGLNAAKGEDHISLSHDYFHVQTAPPAAAQASEDGVARADSESDNPNGLPFQTVTFEQVVELWQHPSYEAEEYVFIDARNDDAFGSGHIPGAHQCDHYRIDQFLNTVMPTVIGATKVVVYCEGSDCEDSLLMCGDLIGLDVPWDAIYLYKPGWEEWEKRGMPAETETE